MTIAEIVEIESNRQASDQYGVIHLLKENNFYRAHDWSAWLMTKFPMGEAKNKPLNISAKRLKDNYIEAWVGFPVASLGKYIPRRRLSERIVRCLRRHQGSHVCLMCSQG